MTLDWFCGRTFEHTDSGVAFTVVSFTRHGDARCHASDGTISTVPMDILRDAVRAGHVVESPTAPIVHGRRQPAPRLLTYIAGRNKQPMRI